MKICQFCAEEIKDEAIVCKHCGRDLIEESKKAPIEVVIAGLGLGLLVVSFGVFFLRAISGSQTDPTLLFGVMLLASIMLLVSLLMRIIGVK